MVNSLSTLIISIQAASFSRVHKHLQFCKICLLNLKFSKTKLKNEIVIMNFQTGREEKTICINICLG